MRTRRRTDAERRNRRRARWARLRTRADRLPYRFEGLYLHGSPATRAWFDAIALLVERHLC